MLSGELKRQAKLKRVLRSVTDAVIVVRDSSAPSSTTGLINTKLNPDSTAPVSLSPAPQSPFQNSSDILIAGEKALVSMPMKSQFLLWTAYKPGVSEFDNNAEGFQKFVTALTQLGVDIDNAIDSTDDDINSIQTYTTLGITIIQILQTSLAASQSLSGSNYTDFQTILATVMSGLSLAAKYVSSEVTKLKTNSINLRAVVTALENSQNLVPSTTPAHLPPKTAVEDSKITIAPTPPTQSFFTPVPGTLIINGSEVDVTLPKQGSGCILKSWSEELSKIGIDETAYYGLLKDLYTLQDNLNNESTACDNTNQFIQSLTSFGTAAIGIIQTAVAGSNISSTGLQIFQITISALNAAAVVVAKVASSSVTDLRNKTLTYSGNVSDLLVSQLKR